MNDSYNIHVKGIPLSLWKRVRVLSAKTNVTIRQIVTDALTQYLCREETED